MTTMLISDDILEHEVRRTVASGARAIHDLSVVAIAGRINLRGVADSYVAKRRAEALARTITGVRHVVNQVRVIPS
jgi:osmotically-inducible protein OsmY